MPDMWLRLLCQSVQKCDQSYSVGLFFLVLLVVSKDDKFHDKPHYFSYFNKVKLQDKKKQLYSLGLKSHLLQLHFFHNLDTIFSR